MSEEKPCRWGIRYTVGGQRTMHVGSDGKPSTMTSRVQALQFAGTHFRNEENPVLVRLIPKKKPRVVAKLDVNGEFRACICCGESQPRWHEISQWFEDRRGKRIRIRLEELSDD